MEKVELLRVALEYIEQHLGDDIRTEDLAAASFCSRSTLEKMFRCVFHISVHGYLIRRRMMRAARELSDQPTKSILVIAMEYGYSTHESFARAFIQISLTLYAAVTSLEKKSVNYTDLHRGLLNAIHEEKSK